MKAIVQNEYGSPDDVLELQDIDKPVVKDGEVLVRVHAVAVNIGDWHNMTGLPYITRMAKRTRLCNYWVTRWRWQSRAASSAFFG